MAAPPGGSARDDEGRKRRRPARVLRAGLMSVRAAQGR
ncbi:hypothetical protein FM112_06330 [Gulosibacter sp. 10]|nr:hypothetical protein FM112_06330 [Gulosibacter sp. 10]